jgi:hypothetical protein
MKDGAAVGSLGNIMGQQLQETGVLQHYAAVMAELAKDLRSEALAVAELSWDELCFEVDPFIQLSRSVEQVTRPYPYFSNLWRSLGQPNSGHAEAAMQLCTAALQHCSSVMQHVVPALQQRVPQEAAVLLTEQYTAISSVMELGNRVMLELVPPADTQEAASSQQGESRTGGDLGMQAQQWQQQALLSPHCLPFVAQALVVTVSWISWSCRHQAASVSQVEGGANSSNSGCVDSGRQQGWAGTGSSSSIGCDTGGSQLDRQHAAAVAAVAAHACASSRGASSRKNITPCQEQLMKLLGLAPQLSDMAELLSKADSDSHPQLVSQLMIILEVFTEYQRVVVSLPHPLEQQHDLAGEVYGDQQQRWLFEQQLWLLLPSALLPCADSLLLPAAGTGRSCWHLCQEQRCAGDLIQHSETALLMYSHIQSWLGGGLGAADLTLAHHTWMEEVLGQALQLADNLLLQQPQPEPPAHAVPTPVGAAPGSYQHSGSSATADPPVSASTYRTLQGVCRAASAAQLLRLLSQLVSQSVAWFPTGSSTAAAAPAAPQAPPVAAKFVQVCTALEAAVRALTTAVQHGVREGSSAVDTCVQGLLIGLHDADGPSGHPDRHESALAQHLGLCGPEALVLEQRQLYSLLSTVRKAAGVLCGGQQAARSWGWATAEAAVGLLQPPPLAVRPVAAAVVEGATARQQYQERQVEHLPSLVIFGRCCLAWAAHLKQLQADAGAQPLAQSLSAEVQQQGPQFQQLTATVSSWVGGAILASPVVHAALAAAAGGEAQQFCQQLEALLAAWQAVGEGLNAPSMAALVQQLQGTGLMLSGIAVPHFCNNPACGNISGPTDVQLVSGRSCLCAGCRTARYCGRGCQRVAWQQHKPVCKALSAAAGAQV